MSHFAAGGDATHERHLLIVIINGYDRHVSFCCGWTYRVGEDHNWQRQQQIFFLKRVFLILLVVDMPCRVSSIVFLRVDMPSRRGCGLELATATAGKYHFH